jgi:hypothetical protein
MLYCFSLQSLLLNNLRLVLVAPKTPGNIGAVARVVANFEVSAVGEAADVQDTEACHLTRHQGQIPELCLSSLPTVCVSCQCRLARCVL